ncbi:MAG TPA: CDP-diacylglycerol--glycerol-3-phosphate 3-phosphatidyltransferase [Gemmatimonadota bacterium]
MNPNRITVARILACPALGALILLDPLAARFGAFVLFLLAAFSDVYDGVLARRSRTVTPFGKIWDPLADKLLLAVTLVPLGVLGELPVWLVLLVLGREVGITAFRRYALARGRLIAASPLGKAKTLSQNLLVGTVLFARVLAPGAARRDAGGWPDTLEGAAAAAAAALVWVVAALTVLSFADYLIRNRALIARGIA